METGLEGDTRKMSGWVVESGLVRFASAAEGVGNPILTFSMKITDALLAEHVVFHALFDHIERSAPGLNSLGEVRALADLLESMLVQHSKSEDELLMNYLEDSIEQMGHRDTFHEEHELIEKHLGAVRSARALKTARRMLVDAVVGARKHFDKEERLVFPLAERVISYHNIMKLGKQWLEKKAV